MVAAKLVTVAAKTGHGGDGNSRYLNLEVVDAQGIHLVTTWNPFHMRRSSFALNGAQVGFFEIDGKAQLPSLEKYLRKKQELSVVFKSED